MAEFLFDTYTGDIIADVGSATLRFTIHTPDALADMNAALEQYQDSTDETTPDGYYDSGIIPLHDLVAADEFPYHTGDYQQSDVRAWDQEGCIAFGGWALEVLNETGERSPDSRLTQKHVERLRMLGAGPGYNRLKTLFSTIGNYRETLGIEPGRRQKTYEDWSFADFTSYAREVEKAAGGRPGEGHYLKRAKEGRGPGIRTIQKRIGSLRQLNEYIGYPDVYAWENEDYYDWGVRVLTANENQNLTSVLLNVLSKRKRGPSASHIVRRFGSIIGFQQDVEKVRAAQEADAEDTRERWSALHDKLAAKEAVTPLPTGDVTNDTERIALQQSKALIAMRYRVAANCLPDVEPKTLTTIAASDISLIAIIRQRSHYTVAAAYIEMVAMSLQVFDQLWPAYHPTYELYVTPDEITTAKARISGYYTRKKAR